MASEPKLPGLGYVIVGLIIGCLIGYGFEKSWYQDEKAQNQILEMKIQSLQQRVDGLNGIVGALQINAPPGTVQ